MNNRAPPTVKSQLGVENNQIKLSDHNAVAPVLVPPVNPYGVPTLPPGPLGAPIPPGPVGAPIPPGPVPGVYPPGPYPPGAYPPGAYPPGPYPGTNPYAANPNITYMDSLVRQTEEENKKLQDELDRIKNDDFEYNNASDSIEELKKQLLPGGTEAAEEPFPVDFVFRQNDFRSEDLEVEERALMNIASQEYDHLRLLSRLPVNSELYRYKMDQYKELSTMRGEIEKVLHEQRLEKLRRDFEKQKYEDERHYNHERWLEEQKREILAAKLRRQEEGRIPLNNNDYTDIPNAVDQPQTQNQYQNQPQTQPMTQQQRPDTNMFPPKTAIPKTVNQPQTEGESVYDPKVGFLAFFDTVARIPRIHTGMQVVYGVYNNGRSLTENRQVTYQDAETDPEQPDMNRVVYDIGHQIKHVQPHPSANMIIECQVPEKRRDGTEGQNISYGWTVVNLFDYTYDFHIGEYRLPLYKGKTLATIDCRDINTLEPVEDTFICMRIALPGDEIATSQYLPEKKTKEYRIPSIHKVKYIPPPNSSDEEEKIPMGNGQDYPNQPLQKHQNKRKPPTERDPFYRCSGINVFIHYVKQFPSQNTIKVGATILEENNVFRIGYDQQECNWMSNPIDADKALIARWKNEVMAQPDGAPIIDKSKPGGDLDYVGYRKNDYNVDNEDIIIQVNNEVSWEHDFYKALWDKNLRNDLFLIVTLLESAPGLNRKAQPSSHEYVTVGYGTIKLNNPDGTIRFGTFDIPCYNPPAKIRNHDPDKRMRTSIKITVSQPLPTLPTEPVINDKPLKKAPGDRHDPLDNAPIAPPNRPPDERPFIPNDKKAYKDEKFDKKDAIDIYIDGCRFLPENCSFTRVTMHVINKAGKSFIDPVITTPDMSVSKSREPFYGFRSELRTSKMDPTLILIFTLDTYDLSNAEHRIVGHAMMPVFLESSTKSPCTDPKSKDFILQDGDYQIPIYSGFPSSLRNITYKDFSEIYKIPCATMLIRIRKAQKDERGRPITIQDIDLDEAIEKDLIEGPSKYGEGKYNTTYTSVNSTEMAIFEAKVNRSNPMIRELVEALFISNQNRKSTSTDSELKEFCEKELLKKPPVNLAQLNKFEYFDIRFFSEYIPQLGFFASLDFIHNQAGKSLFYAVMSINPPGVLYSDDRDLDLPSSDTTVKSLFRLDFDSPLKACTFHDKQQQFSISKPTLTAELIIEIIEVQISESEIKNTKTFGYTFLPIFQYVEVDGDSSSTEIYVNTSVNQLPIIEGLVEKELLFSKFKLS